MTKRFDIENEFQVYCERSKLNLDTCSPIQVVEMRRTFYGAVGQFLFYLKLDLADATEDDGVVELERVQKQVAAFWKRQAK
jgi:hypothetical protein